MLNWKDIERRIMDTRSRDLNQAFETNHKKFWNRFLVTRTVPLEQQHQQELNQFLG